MVVLGFKEIKKVILFLLKHVSQKQYHSVNEQTRGILPASLSNLAYLL